MKKSDSGHPVKESVCVPVAMAAPRRGAVMTHPIRDDSSVLYGPGGTGRSRSEIRTAARAPAKRRPGTGNTLRPGEDLGAKQDTHAADGSYSAYLPELGILKSLAHPPAVAPAPSSVAPPTMAPVTLKPLASITNPHATSYVGEDSSSATEASSSALPAEHEETIAPVLRRSPRTGGASLTSAPAPPADDTKLSEDLDEDSSPDGPKDIPSFCMPKKDYDAVFIDADGNVVEEGMESKTARERNKKALKDLPDERSDFGGDEGGCPRSDRGISPLETALPAESSVPEHLCVLGGERGELWG